MKHEIFAYNLKKAIKKRGFKITTFPVLYLNCSYPVFKWRLDRGKITLNNINTIIDILNVSFDELNKKPKGYKQT